MTTTTGWPNGSRLSPPEFSKRAQPSDIKRARDFIHLHFADEFSLGAVARVAGISPGHLSEKFKQVTGMNFVHYVGQFRVQEACVRLEQSRRTISEIAFEVGFQSLSQFNRVFKKQRGQSPTAYRRMIRGRTSNGS